jgi:predicted ArsR family transcriptional regulator
VLRLDHDADALAELGFEPRPEAEGRLILRNCPFHEIAQMHPDLVCGINHAFVTGLLTGLQIRALTAHVAPRPGACCVALRGPTA